MAAHGTSVGTSPLAEPFCGGAPLVRGSMGELERVAVALHGIVFSTRREAALAALGANGCRFSGRAIPPVEQWLEVGCPGGTLH
jgi:hypothetical protein